MGGVPSVPSDRTPRLRVIGAGYSRTGTVTMQLALEKLLDGPVLHGGTQVLGREDAYCAKWVRAYAAKRAGDHELTLSLLRELTAGFVACTDMPPIDFVPELMEIYPEAKVVLTTRDPERWMASIAVVAKHASVENLGVLRYIIWAVPGWRWFPALSTEFGRSAGEIMAEGSTEVNPDPMTSLLLNWNKRVKQMVPPEKLLTMEVKEGWQPLCEFLELPVPNEPFPRANDSLAAEKTGQDIKEKLLRVGLGGLTVVVAAVGIGAWQFMKRQ